MIPSGELEKLTIRAFSDPKFLLPAGAGTFTTLINPEKYIFNYKIEQNLDQAQGTSANSLRFNKILPANLDLDFVFDRTGAIKESEVSDLGITQDIEKFKSVVLNYFGAQHKPNYLIISWGTLIFLAVLTDLSVEFKLFNSNGIPIRAIAKAKFKNFIEDELRVAREKNQSPDLTHLRTVKEGDTLPLMSYSVYGDSKYYLEVAKTNNLHNFRKLSVGQQLFFPPIAKIS